MWFGYDEYDKSRLILGGFSADLLSHGIDKAQQGDVWLTVLTNHNMTAPASIIDISCFIICDDIAPTELLIEKARLIEINLLKTKLPVFDCAIALNKTCNNN